MVEHDATLRIGRLLRLALEHISLDEAPRLEELKKGRDRHPVELAQQGEGLAYRQAFAAIGGKADEGVRAARSLDRQHQLAKGEPALGLMPEIDRVDIAAVIEQFFPLLKCRGKRQARRDAALAEGQAIKRAGERAAGGDERALAVRMLHEVPTDEVMRVAEPILRYVVRQEQQARILDRAGGEDE